MTKGSPARALFQADQRLRAQIPALSAHAKEAFEHQGLLGEGGMGEVQRVLDRRLGRQAALKLLKTGGIERFRRELRLTANLEHPGIPPVYEAGVDPDGRPYLLMRLIEGRTLSELIREAWSEGYDPLRVRGLIEVLIEAARAIAYAHSKGVVHRDLKPANIMVGRFGEVAVIDWGLAKPVEAPRIIEAPGEAQLPANDSEARTRIGAIIGTLQTMAPEQANGRAVDARSDIFSLGVILSAMASGVEPRASLTPTELLVGALTGDLRLPSQLHPDAPRELDAIVRRATATKPSNRYRSAAALIKDLRRFLDGKRPQAYRDSAPEAALRFVRRRPASCLTAAACVALALIGALLGVAVQRARRQEVQAARAARLSARAGDAAAALRAKLEAAFQSYFKAATLARRGAPEAELTAVIDDFLARGARGEAALMAAAEVYERAGDEGRAAALLEEAARRFPPAYSALFYRHRLEVKRRGVGGAGDSSPWIEELVREARRRGEVNDYTLYYEAEELYAQDRAAQALPLAQRLVERAPNFVDAYLLRGCILGELKRYGEALADLDLALRLDPNRAVILIARGAVVYELGEEAQALEDFEAALRLEPEYALAHLNRAGALAETGRLEESLQGFARAIELRPGFAKAYRDRGLILERLGRGEEAREDLERATRFAPELAEGFHHLGRVLRELGRSEEALAQLAIAIERDPELADAYSERALALADLGRYEEAIKAMDRGLELAPKDAILWCNRGFICGDAGRPDEALKSYDKALAIDPNQAEALNNRAHLHRDRGDFERARADFQRFLRVAGDHPLAENARAALSKLP